MDSAADRRIAYMEGDSALPRSNGELVFEAPWEGRAFGLAVALTDQGACEWEDFREGLIAEIAGASGVPSASGAPSSASDVPSEYYQRWLAALETLAVSEGLVSQEELDLRAEEYASGEREDDHW